MTISHMDDDEPLEFQQFQHPWRWLLVVLLIAVVVLASGAAPNVPTF